MVLLAGIAMPGVAWGAEDLVVLEVRVDRPTIRALGVQVLVSDDDDRDASGTMRVREAGRRWREAPSLFRVRPETVGIAVPEQLSGSVLDLDPDTLYEIEIHLVDPDGLDHTEIVEATTRPIPPSDPSRPNEIAVSDAAGLSAALGTAQPGDVIVLAPGTYAGNFAIQASGTASDPIVIRGEDARGVILDGQDCTGCNVLEVYGSWVHVEDLTVANGERALRWQGVGAEGNVLRRVVISNVIYGVGSREGQLDFYVCDNEIVGRLDWPWVFDGDAGSHWDDRGIDLNGDGHVICHNRIEGFGDPMVNLTEGTRAWDFYGNDVYDCFDGIELDRVAGNVRVFRNRWVNVDSAISMQPVNGGPVYVVRNEVINAVSEQLKLKATGGEPSGALVHHNTFVSPSRALNLQTPITVHNFVVSNNLFVGPQALVGARTVDWTAAVDGDRFDHNGYFPDGEFWFGVVGGSNRLYASFAKAIASGAVEGNGVLLAATIFEGGALGPADPMIAATPVELDLDASSNAIDAGEVVPGISDASPDVGARERGCAAPTYGPRTDESSYVPILCREDEGGDDSGSSGSDDAGSGSGDDDGSGSVTNGDDGPTTGDATGGSSSAGATDGGSEGAAANESGCGCRSSPPSVMALALLFAVPRRRSSRRGSRGR